jgi:dTMP kinase
MITNKEITQLKKPIVLAICGIDGSGKTTQVTLLADLLAQKGFKVKITKAKMINSEVLFSLSEKMFGDKYDYHPGIPPLLMNVVLACDAAHHYLNEDKQWDDYDFVICDRHKLCYEAYSDAYGTDMEWIRQILTLINDPDLVFYIETPVEIAINRLNNRIDKPIRSDETPEILNESLKSYRKLIPEKTNVVSINGNNKPEDMHNIIKNTLENRFFSIN